MGWKTPIPLEVLAKRKDLKVELAPLSTMESQHNITQEPAPFGVPRHKPSSVKTQSVKSSTSQRRSDHASRTGSVTSLISAPQNDTLSVERGRLTSQPPPRAPTSVLTKPASRSGSQSSTSQRPSSNRSVTSQPPLSTHSSKKQPGGIYFKAFDANSSAASSTIQGSSSQSRSGSRGPKDTKTVFSGPPQIIDSSAAFPKPTEAYIGVMDDSDEAEVRQPSFEAQWKSSAAIMKVDVYKSHESPGADQFLIPSKDFSRKDYGLLADLSDASQLKGTIVKRDAHQEPRWSVVSIPNLFGQVKVVKSDDPLKKLLVWEPTHALDHASINLDLKLFSPQDKTILEQFKGGLQKNVTIRRDKGGWKIDKHTPVRRPPLQRSGAVKGRRGIKIGQKET
ncbi:MAG: hypothetical protein CYPHOPRED_003463 [Cyphobasidiales sp. Tagirdzhanova-0007]|nr:MAG: hypothetical protein CYPHOPRED_003463 [Cyphobasidiales sp. Tagirdzhanova-0007]